MSENKALQKDLDEATKKVKGFEENSNIQDKSKENEVIAEIVLLEEEIENLELSNADKETILKRTEAEKKELIDKIEIMEAEKETAKETDVVESFTAKSLEEELCLSGFERQMFECKHCETTFLNMNDLKYHVKEIHVDQARETLIRLQNQIANQTKILATSNFKLIQKEISEKHNPCKCRYKFCRIIHTKHNWSRSIVSDIITRFEEVKNLE